MQLEKQFDLSDLETINEQAMFYMCACPAQVAAQITSLRNLFDYQSHCLNASSNDEVQTQVHQRIGQAVEQAHQILENCLDDVLRLENWNRDTLEMPAGLRALMEHVIDAE